MKILFKYLGLATIICLSFILTEKTVTVMNDMDEIMNTIKEQEKNYNIEPIDAKIENEYIKPGKYGKKVNIKKSYENMKKIGKFNDKYLIYDEIKPNISLEDNKDKIIIGNQNKTISLIFIIKKTDDIEQIKKILNKKNIKASFFVDSEWLKKNKEICKELIKENHTIGNIENSSNMNYFWVNNTIQALGQQKNYCYYENCKNTKDYKIKPTKTIKNSSEIKKHIEPGDIIEIEKNKDLAIIIDYIKSRGIELENIANHIEEKN